MATSRKKPVKRKEAEAVETKPDAWGEFQRTMDKTVPRKQPKLKGQNGE